MSPSGPVRFRVIWGDPYHGLAQIVVEAYDPEEAMVTAAQIHPELPRPRAAFVVRESEAGAVSYNSPHEPSF